MALDFGDAISGFAQTDGWEEGGDRGVVNTAARNYLFIVIALFTTDYGTSHNTSER